MVAVEAEYENTGTGREGLELASERVRVEDKGA
jgi:hypothetical protein